LGDTGADGRRIIKLTLKKQCEGDYWINLAYDGAQRQALVNTVINFHVP
jgi:hypothetical protein